MPKMSDAFAGKSLKAEDLKGKRILVTIDGGQWASFDDDTRKWCVKFRGKDKTLTLNKTNWGMIAEIIGSDDTDDWDGKQIVLYSTKVDYAGKRVDAIRVDYPPNAKPATPPPVVDESEGPSSDGDDSIPF